MKEKKITITPRWLARRMAKAKLDSDGATGYNKKPKAPGGKGESHFQRNWRELALKARNEAAKRAKAGKKARA